MYNTGTYNDTNDICFCGKVLEAGDYHFMKECTVCHKDRCLNCIAITACQTTEGICKQCFDYKCDHCGVATLCTQTTYLYDDEPYPVCSVCRAQLV